MTLTLSEVSFGQNDARNEVFQQDRYGGQVFENAFQIPPGVDLDEVYSGAKFFITGSKGSGKTSLLLHMKKRYERLDHWTNLVLFKSHLSEPERQRIAQGYDIQVLNTKDDGPIDHDLKINWLWFIYRMFLRAIDEEHILQGKDILRGLKKAFSISDEIPTSRFSDLKLSRINSMAKAGVQAGPFGGEIGTDLEIIRRNKDVQAPISLIELCENYLPRIKIHPKHRYAIFFDELELFWNKADQRHRDLILIRDLLHAVSRFNKEIGQHSASLVAYASVRAEVLHEINRQGPEIARDIEDLGVSINWNTDSDADHQPILDIVEAKIHASEIENELLPTADIWSTYFVSRYFGRKNRQYLIDISMLRPRSLIILLNSCKKIAPNATQIDDNVMSSVQTEFSSAMWREIEEELAGAYNSSQVSIIKNIFSGWKSEFSLIELQARVRNLSTYDARYKSLEADGIRLPDLVVALYRMGALGNVYHVTTGSRPQRRDRWVFRSFPDPLIDRTFVVHESLRKSLQLAFV